MSMVFEKDGLLVSEPTRGIRSHKLFGWAPPGTPMCKTTPIQANGSGGQPIGKGKYWGGVLKGGKR